MRPFTAALICACGIMTAAADRAQAEPQDDAGLKLKELLALGIGEYRLDAGTDLTGWQLNGSWYFGHRDGDQADGLSLVWQGERQQVSISAEGIHFIRRF